MEAKHVSVLLPECIDSLNIRPEGVYVDGTLGMGGHSEEIAKRLTTGKLIGIDRDETAIRRAGERLRPYGDRVQLVHGNFRDTAEILDDLGIEAVDGMLFDLGVSSPQLDESERGFSFAADEKLDMRLNAEQELSAEDVINIYPETELADIIYRYGEERYSRRIAERICRERQVRRITTARQLADIVAAAVPAAYRHGRLNPATRTFQAIRIEVNRELDRIEPALKEAVRVLKKGGRVGVITFHSLEDRKVKWFFKGRADEEGDITILTKKPICPSEKETGENAPSRSAKLRVSQKR